jgi:hypothetical protein
MMKYASQASHRVIYRDEYSYCAHPQIVALKDGQWLIVFNRTVRRPFLLHPPEDPHYYNVLIRSSDNGETWSVPRVVPGYDWYGVECAGLTPLEDGTLLLNQWRFRWYPLEKARKMGQVPGLVFPEQYIHWMKDSNELDIGKPFPENMPDLFPWARANGGTYAHLSSDGGKTWNSTVEIDTSPHSGGYGMRGGVQLANGEILLPLSDVPNYKKVFVVRSKDRGRTWEPPVIVAAGEDFWFEEPSAILLPNGCILMMLRENRTHELYQVTSSDGGYCWTPPRRIPVWGYPAHLLMLPDQRVLCVYGYRAAPYGIRAMLSRDLGQTWDVDDTLIIRDDLPNRDLGYPSSVVVDRDRIFTVYYGEDENGVTGIMGSYYSIKENA